MSHPCRGINYNRSDWKVPTQTWTGVEVIVWLHWATCCLYNAFFPLACGSKETNSSLSSVHLCTAHSFSPLHIFSISFLLCGFLFIDHGECFFCGWGEGGSLTPLWEDSRFFWHQWEGGMDKKRCRLQTSLLNGCVLFCNSLMSCSRRSPAATAGLTPTFICTENAAARVPTYMKSTKLLVALWKKLECVGILFVLHQGLMTARFIMTETYCYLCSWHPQLRMYCTQLVSLVDCCLYKTHEQLY